jgi:hypothetical protein
MHKAQRRDDMTELRRQVGIRFFKPVDDALVDPAGLSDAAAVSVRLLKVKAAAGVKEPQKQLTPALRPGTMRPVRQLGYEFSRAQMEAAEMLKSLS